MTCSHTHNCQLYTQFAADPSLKLWQQHYCESNYTSCARYQIALTGKAIPLTMLPNGKQLHRYRKRDEMAAAALFNAIQKDRIPVVKSLINGKISSEVIKMADGTTPLMAAVERGNKAIAKLLLEAGCSPLHKNDSGETAMDIATRKGFIGCMKLIEPFMQKQPDSDPAAQAPKEDSSIMHDVLSFLRKLNPVR